jgi:DNA-binding transcriptional MerR regulator
MPEESYSLTDLAEVTGIEERTIRSYIERGLLPGAQTRGRGASYSSEHLSGLHLIRSLRRARPNITLSEIRIVLQGLAPQEIHTLAAGSITAMNRRADASLQPDGIEYDELPAGNNGEIPRKIDWEACAAELTGAERLVRLLREVSGYAPSTPSSKVEGWQRITVTPDVELSVRAEFHASQLAVFRELADLLRHLLQRADALSKKDDE